MFNVMLCLFAILANNMSESNTQAQQKDSSEIQSIIEKTDDLSLHPAEIQQILDHPKSRSGIKKARRVPRELTQDEISNILQLELSGLTAAKVACIHDIPPSQVNKIWDLRTNRLLNDKQQLIKKIRATKHYLAKEPLEPKAASNKDIKQVKEIVEEEDGKLKRESTRKRVNIQGNGSAKPPKYSDYKVVSALQELDEIKAALGAGIDNSFIYSRYERILDKLFNKGAIDNKEYTKRMKEIYKKKAASPAITYVEDDSQPRKRGNRRESVSTHTTAKALKDKKIKSVAQPRRNRASTSSDYSTEEESDQEYNEDYRDVDPFLEMYESSYPTKRTRHNKLSSSSYFPTSGDYDSDEEDWFCQ